MNPPVISQHADVTETSIKIASTAPGVSGLVSSQLQYGTRADFDYSIAPIFGAAAAATQTFSKLNRSQTYYFRERGVDAGGLVGPWSNVLAVQTSPGTDPSPGIAAVLIQPALIVVPAYVSEWGASGSMAGYSPAAVGDPSPSTGWRVSAAGTRTLGAVLGGAQVDTVALLDTNLPEDATWAIRVYDLAGGLTATYGPMAFRASSGLPGRRGYHGFFRFPAPLAAAGIQIDIAGTVPGNVVHVTHAIFGLARATRNYSDLGIQPFDLGQLNRQRDGSPIGIPGFRGKRVDFTISALTETQHETAYADLADRVGLDQPVFVVPNSKPGIYLHDRLLYGPLLSTRIGWSRLRAERQFSVESIINP